MTIEGMKELAAEIRNEVAPSANTAEKVGSLLEAVIDTEEEHAAEATRAKGVEGGLRRDLTAETAAREAADRALQASIDDEMARAVAAEGGLRTDLTAEADAREAADAAESSARSSGDAALQAAVDQLVAGIPDVITEAEIDAVLNGDYAYGNSGSSGASHQPPYPSQGGGESGDTGLTEEDIDAIFTS